jgi:hypothetical protein
VVSREVFERWPGKKEDAGFSTGWVTGTVFLYMYN